MRPATGRIARRPTKLLWSSNANRQRSRDCNSSACAIGSRVVVEGRADKLVTRDRLKQIAAFAKFCKNYARGLSGPV